MVEVTPRPSSGLPSPTTTAPFGTPLSVADAERLLGEELPLPAELGRPDRVLGGRPRTPARWSGSRRREPSADVPAIEGSRFGAVLMRFEADTDQAFKDVYEDTGTVDGVRRRSRGRSTTGPHVLRLLTSEGVVDVRVEGNVLLWTDGAHTMRLETAVPVGRRSHRDLRGNHVATPGVAGVSDREEGSR